MFNQKCIVMSSSEYDFEDEKTRKKVRGVSFQYVATDILTKCENPNGSKGYKVANASLSLDKAHKFIEVPAIYNLSLDMAIVGGGKSILKITDVDFVSSFELIS